MSIKEKKTNRKIRKQMLKKILATGGSTLSLLVLLNACGNNEKTKAGKDKNTENAPVFFSTPGMFYPPLPTVKLILDEDSE